VKGSLIVLLKFHYHLFTYSQKTPVSL